MLAGVKLGVLAIQVAEEVEIVFLRSSLLLSRWFQVENAWFTGTDYGSLIQGRQPAVAPIEDALDGKIRRIA